MHWLYAALYQGGRYMYMSRKSIYNEQFCRSLCSVSYNKITKM